MAMTLQGGCRCGAIGFSLDSHTPYPELSIEDWHRRRGLWIA
ncbi:MAG TPA: hypothetical protein VFM56_02485 [Solimonas sp.]|nr:hypothetical protein [Solimonas sp.]